MEEGAKVDAKGRRLHFLDLSDGVGSIANREFYSKVQEVILRRENVSAKLRISINLLHLPSSLQATPNLTVPGSPTFTTVFLRRRIRRHHYTFRYEFQRQDDEELQQIHEGRKYRNRQVQRKVTVSRVAVRLARCTYLISFRWQSRVERP